MRCSPRLGFGDSVESDSPTLGGLCRRLGFNPWVRKVLWSRKWQPTPVFLPGKLHGQRSLVGYGPWGRKRVGHDLAHTHTRTNTSLSPAHGTPSPLPAPFLLRQSLLLHPIPLFILLQSLLKAQIC